MEIGRTRVFEISHASGIRGKFVVSRKEGKLLGEVSHVFISPEERKLSSIVVKDNFWNKTRLHIPSGEIEFIGEDVVFIHSEKSCEAVSDIDRLPGLSIKNLQGHWITTRNGKHLGQFLDVNFSSENWTISEFLMSEDKALRVDPTEITIGADEILAPPGYLSKVVKQKKRTPGILSRVFSEDTADQVSQTKKRDLKKASPPEKTLPSDEYRVQE